MRLGVGMYSALVISVMLYFSLKKKRIDANVAKC